MTIVERIVERKREEVARLRPDAAMLRSAAEAAGPTRGFAAALRGDNVGVIAEFKRRSPSAGWLDREADAGAVARAYAAAGAAAMSVLTDGPGFGGSLADLETARSAAALPVLRKDFVVDEVQLWEARAAGADAALLIVRIVEQPRLAALLQLATELGLDALVEAHDAADLERALDAGASLVGVNNRDLATFETDLAVSLGLAARVPPAVTLVAESGIRTGEDVERLGAAGVDAVLVGERLMRAGAGSDALAGLVGRPRHSRRDVVVGEAP